MSMYAIPGESCSHGFLAATGLAGTARIRIVQGSATTTAATTAGITEYPASSGAYQATFTAPTTLGNYLVLIDDGSATPDHVSAVDLVVTFTSPSVSASSGDYITESDLKSARELTGYTFADGQIPNVITAASRVVDRLCGTKRRFYLDTDATQVRYYTARSTNHLEIDDLTVCTSVATDNNGDGTFELTWTSGTDFDLEPFNAAADSWPYETITVRPFGRYRFPTFNRGVKVTGQFGWASVPADVWTATLILSVRYLLRTREAPAGIIATGGVEGSMMRLARTDPDVPGLLERYSRKALLL